MMYADSDEFFDMDGAELLRRVEAYGGFVVGHMVDRIARDWTLRAYDGADPLWQYCLCLPLTRGRHSRVGYHTGLQGHAHGRRRRRDFGLRRGLGRGHGLGAS